MAEKGWGKKSKANTIFLSSSGFIDLDVSFQFIEIVVTFAVLKAGVSGMS